MVPPLIAQGASRCAIRVGMVLRVRVGHARAGSGARLSLVWTFDDWRGSGCGSLAGGNPETYDTRRNRARTGFDKRLQTVDVSISVTLCLWSACNGFTSLPM